MKKLALLLASILVAWLIFGEPETNDRSGIAPDVAEIQPAPNPKPWRAEPSFSVGASFPVTSAVTTPGGGVVTCYSPSTVSTSTSNGIIMTTAGARRGMSIEY